MEDIDISTLEVVHPMPVARFEHNDQWYRYDPQEDITALEVALLLPTFMHTLRPVDIYGYLEKYELLRHFVYE